MKKERILAALKNYDRDVYLKFGNILTEKAACYIVGGSAFMLLDLIPRATLDIDILKTIGLMAEKYHEFVSLMNKYDINMNSSTYNDCFCDLNSYKERAVKLELNTRAIDFYVLSLEDLVVSKLASGREKDLLDIRESPVVSNINWELLEKIANEVKNGMITDLKISFFEIAYEEYRKEFGNERAYI